MTQRINFQTISMHASPSRKHNAVMEEMARVGEENVLITDCLSHKGEGGLLILQRMENMIKEEHKVLRFKIRVLRDRWGNPVKPGDKIEWLFKRRTRDSLGKKITMRYIKELRRRGEERQVEIWHNAIVDEYGCIDVPFHDAALLLDLRGVHFESNQPLTAMKEHSTSIQKTPDGTMRPQHYWLYEEVPPWEYENLTKKRRLINKTNEVSNAKSIL